ncbi:hypothetical protein JQR84_23810 (plasmid) [Pseudomonas luteola]|uniref:hypothetical protein n=1 Tax=Pseudomonas TaxID=286 RepID=UPI003DA08F31
MPSKTEHLASICNVKTLNRGLKVWWVHEMPLVLKGCYSNVVISGAVIITFTIVVHVFFALGVLMSALLPADIQTHSSLLAFEHSPEVVVPLASLGFAPFMAMATLASWARHVCSMGKVNP